MLFLIIIIVCGYFISHSISTFIATIRFPKEENFFIDDTSEIRKLFYEFEREIKSEDACYKDFFRLATLYARRKDWVRAEKHYLKAIELNPNFVKAYNNLGNVYFHLGKLDKAVKYYEKASKIAPEYLNVRINLGFAYLKKGFIKEAISEWDYVLKKDPGNQEIISHRKHIFK